AARHTGAPRPGGREEAASKRGGLHPVATTESAAPRPLSPRCGPRTRDPPAPAAGRDGSGARRRRPGSALRSSSDVLPRRRPNVIHGKRERKPGSRFTRLVDPDAASVRLDQALTDGKPQPGAAPSLVRRGEAIEDL